MDELVIGEKKYISSKLAAKATGYAKDYIGQLCREGRVPARLVGRSWYVLESAIQDHRFGNLKEEPILESPRYEASPAEALPPPPANLIRDTPSEVSTVSSQYPHDAWKAWFDRFNTAEEEVRTPEPEKSIEPITDDAEVIKEEEREKEVEREIEEEEEMPIETDQNVNIPIHTVYQIQDQLPPEDLAPQRRVGDNVEEDIHKMPKRRTGVMTVLKLAGILLAISTAIIATMSSGYVDSYILSNSQARILSGIILYNK